MFRPSLSPDLFSLAPEKMVAVAIPDWIAEWVEERIDRIFLVLIYFTAVCILFLGYRWYTQTPSLPGGTALKNVLPAATKATAPFPTEPTRIVKHKVDGYEVWEIYNVFTPEECEHVKRVAEQVGLGVSEVISYGSPTDTAIDTTFRTSRQAWIKDAQDPLFEKFADYTARLTGLPKENQEMAQVVKYNEGGEFYEHWDACVHDNKEFCNRLNRGAGQRQATLLVYLNDVEKGGETYFPKINITVRPEKGKGILFWDARPDDTIIDNALHTGKKVLKGEKWIVTKWTHTRPYIDGNESR